MADDDELVDFLRDWKREIAESSDHTSTSQKHILGKRKLSNSIEGECMSSESAHEEGICPKLPALMSEDVPPLLVLPAAKLQARGQLSVQVDKELTQAKEEDFVDTLISDLNEINSIPFFEVQLPREIAIVIFGFLDMHDLCTCSLVSKSWSSLADDNLLWSRICRNLGYSTQSNQMVERSVSWKSVVRDLVIQKRQVLQNWKERICRLRDHQPDNCGVLYCLSYEQCCVLSCYSSGAVYVWNLKGDNGPVRVSVPSQFQSPVPINCALKSGWGVLGNSDGSLSIIDTDTCSHVHTVTELGSSIDSLSISCSETHTAIAVASHHYRTFTDKLLSNIVLLVATDGCKWERRNILPQCESKIMKVSLFPFEGGDQSPFAILYSTSSGLHFSSLSSAPTSVLASMADRGPTSTHITCFDCSPTTIACGTSAFGYQIQLFDLHSLAFKGSLRGHGQHVSCLDIASAPVNMLVSGSADKRVRAFDCRHSQPSLILSGHSSVVRSVQMDHWKVVSGSYDGTVIVWDQRMARELWRSHERHPVDLCSFDESYLVVGHVPVDKQPDVYTGNPHICHRRQRGLVRVCDFSVDPLYYTKTLPSVCSSMYDEPDASFYNLDLKYPYDDITT